MIASTEGFISDVVIINSVRERLPLWDKKSDDYKNVVTKGRHWDLLAKELEKPATYLQARWKYLRETFIRNDKMGYTTSGSEAKPVSSWPYMKIMSFMIGQYTPRATTGNLKRVKKISPENRRSPRLNVQNSPVLSKPKQRKQGNSVSETRPDENETQNEPDLPSSQDF